MKILEILRENSITPELEKKFGRVLFGDWQFKNGLRKNHEKDTKYEKELFELIDDWYAGFTEKEHVQNAIIELSQLKDYYPTLIKPDPVSRFPYLYRALDLYSLNQKTMPDLKSLIKKSVFHSNFSLKSQNIKNKKYNFKLHKIDSELNYTPLKPVESWTISLKSVIDVSMIQFAMPSGGCIIFKCAVPEEERLFKFKISNIIFGEKQYEVIRVSTNSIKAEEVFIVGY